MHTTITLRDYAGQHADVEVHIRENGSAYMRVINNGTLEENELRHILSIMEHAQTYGGRQIEGGHTSS